MESVVIVLYFHDLEKIFKYSKNVEEIDFEQKLIWYNVHLPTYGVILTNEEKNALYYIHGEGTDYRKNRRVMNELGGFCHACDILSARVFHSIKNI
jgi:hypothetical protein